MLTGKDVLDAFKSDLEGFFYPDSGFVMNTAIQGSKTVYMGDANKGGVVVSKDLASHEVGSLEELVLILLILGHESAHLINVHNGYRDQTNDDTRAIEVWADFFGTKIAVVMLTFGEKILDLVTSFPGGAETGTRIDAIGAAIGRLAVSYFETNDGRYEPAPVRVATCVAGVMSALDTFWAMQGKGRSVARSLSIQKRLYASPVMTGQLLRADARAPDRSQLPLLRQIHKVIQGDRDSITPGMRDLPKQWLGTDYRGSEEARLANVKLQNEILMAELKKLGLEIPPE